MLIDESGSLTLSESGLRSYFRGLTGGLGVSAAIVLDAKGRYRDSLGGSRLLSSALDRVWLSVLRSGAEAIVSSGATVRSEGLRQTQTPLVIASLSGDITGLRPSNAGELLIASSVTGHPSWPENAKHFGSLPHPLAVVELAKQRWQRLQVELGLENLIAGYRSGLIDSVYITAPTEAAAKHAFGPVVRLVALGKLQLFLARRSHEHQVQGGVAF